MLYAQLACSLIGGTLSIVGFAGSVSVIRSGRGGPKTLSEEIARSSSATRYMTIGVIGFAIAMAGLLLSSIQEAS